MPKLKTNRSVQKRMRVTKNGKIKHFKAGKGHLLVSKRGKRKRQLGKAGYVSKADIGFVRLLLPHGA